jgi:hypothetical protein
MTWSRDVNDLALGFLRGVTHSFLNRVPALVTSSLIRKKPTSPTSFCKGSDQFFRDLLAVGIVPPLERVPDAREFALSHGAAIQLKLCERQTGLLRNLFVMLFSSCGRGLAPFQ